YRATRVYAGDRRCPLRAQSGPYTATLPGRPSRDTSFAKPNEGSSTPQKFRRSLHQDVSARTIPASTERNLWRTAPADSSLDTAVDTARTAASTPAYDAVDTRS